MDAPDARAPYSILIDGHWTFHNLSEYPKLIDQVYLALYALSDRSSDHIMSSFGGIEKISDGGGYGTVNFYSYLRRNSPGEATLKVKSIKYNSPGWIEIIADAPTIAKVAASVSSVAASIGVCHQVYMRIRKGVFEIRKRQREDRKELFDLRREEIKFLKEGAKQLDSIMKIGGLEKAEASTKDPEATVQIYLGLYRRVEQLVDYKKSGKAELP
ncbi:hypothetical protein [Aureimonas psammosilenae]|uniref:hypothetical protein n=1 Tax=Aureimonas psammosilenae TaxID=2495496 RepID=UPI001260B342|nr:hypothetical protein [Aureimonas psammosilenae]